MFLFAWWKRLNPHSESRDNIFFDDGAGSSYEHLPKPVEMHNRAAASAHEVRSNVLKMAGASLGFFFVALVGSEPSPELTDVEQVTLLVAIIAMAASVFSGIWCAHADARRSYSWAKALELQHQRLAKASNVTESVDEIRWKNARQAWHNQKQWSEPASMLLFAVGLLIASAYLVLRAF